eukprot:scaffold86559_cov23-Tisochrysis_lutea.AAC.3
MVIDNRRVAVVVPFLNECDGPVKQLLATRKEMDLVLRSQLNDATPKTDDLSNRTAIRPDDVHNTLQQLGMMQHGATQQCIPGAKQRKAFKVERLVFPIIKVISGHGTLRAEWG